ncbi:hypothetical protein C8Q78DRAFT_1064318 [Trametes maxima]|nr:hypothetical protein C8Q78DRAFT_1064318 [Trametes maxima]
MYLPALIRPLRALGRPLIDFVSPARGYNVERRPKNFRRQFLGIHRRCHASEHTADESGSVLEDPPPIPSADVISLLRDPCFDIRTLRRGALSSEDCIHLNTERRTLNIRLVGIPEPNANFSRFEPASESLLQFSGFSTSDTQHPKVALVPGLDDEEKFPSGLRGFLYYWTPPAHITPLAGEINFRVTSNNDPTAGFRAGHDYKIRTGGRWRLPLLTLAWASGYEPLRDALLREELVDADTMKLAEALGHGHKLLRNVSRVVHSFHQHFVLDLSTQAFTFYFLGRGKLHKTMLLDLCNYKDSTTRPAVQPFEGQVLCRFEPAKPSHRLGGGRRVVIRVAKILKPVRYAPNWEGPTHVPLPQQGKLLRTFVSSPPLGHWRRPRPGPRWALWSMDVDKTHREMRVLFEHQKPSEGTTELSPWASVFGTR